MPQLHEVDKRIFTAPVHGRCVCPLTPVDSPATFCERHGIDKTGMERLYCRALLSSFLARESQGQPVGPGTALRGLLSRLGLQADKSCQCDKRAAQMDAWGLAGCLEHRAEIVAWLNEEAAKIRLPQKTRAGVKAIGLGLVINPLSPGEWLLDEALRRAERQADGS